MEIDKKTVRTLALSALLVLAGYWCLENLALLARGLGALLSMVSPFLLGCAMAFILNVPMRAIERKLFPNATGRRASLRRPLAYVLTLALVVGVLALASFVVVPNLAEAISSVAYQANAAVRRLPDQIAALSAQFPEIQGLLNELNIDWAGLMQQGADLLQSLGNGLVNSGVGLVGGLVSGVSTTVIGFVFSIYVLLQKERLAGQIRQCLYALLPEPAADQVLEVAGLANRTFSSFLSGQCLEAVILGSMFVVAMWVLRLPYALLVGVLIALTALIPIVGAFIGCGVGALLILLVDPWRALLFIVLFLVLQQVEGNLIYPQVVGSSVGLPSIWVLAAVTVGGKLMGVVGMLVFIPLCSVVYALFRRFVKGRLTEKGIPPEKLRPQPAAKPPKELKASKPSGTPPRPGKP